MYNLSTTLTAALDPRLWTHMFLRAQGFEKTEKDTYVHSQKGIRTLVRVGPKGGMSREIKMETTWFESESGSLTGQEQLKAYKEFLGKVIDHLIELQTPCSECHGLKVQCTDVSEESSNAQRCKHCDGQGIEPVNKPVKSLEEWNNIIKWQEEWSSPTR